MKNLKKLSLLVISMLLVLVLATGCAKEESKEKEDNKDKTNSTNITETDKNKEDENKEEDKNNSNVVAEVKVPAGYTKYEDKTKGVSFVYPSTWEKSGNVCVDMSTGSSVNVLTETLPSEMTLDAYVLLTKGQLKNQTQIEVVGEVAEKKATIGGKDAVILSYKAKMSEITMKLEQVVIIEDKTAYILTIGSMADSFDSQKEVFATIKDSFRIK